MNEKTISRAFLMLLLGSTLCSCATASRGSHTIFKVETVPEGAKVVTDLVYKGDTRNREGSNEGAVIYYGCDATPCGIKLPRRSDFNVMAIKSGYQPSTYAVFKERNKMASRKTETTSAGIVATGAVLGGVTAASVAAEYGIIGAVLFPPGAVVASSMILAAPVAGAATGVDLASGALIDLVPNPLQMQLKPEVSPEDTEQLINAFVNSRRQRKEAH